MQEFKANEEEGERAKEAEGSWLGAYTYYTYIKESLALALPPNSPNFDVSAILPSLRYSQ